MLNKVSLRRFRPTPIVCQPHRSDLTCKVCLWMYILASPCGSPSPTPPSSICIQEGRYSAYISQGGVVHCAVEMCCVQIAAVHLVPSHVPQATGAAVVRSATRGLRGHGCALASRECRQGNISTTLPAFSVVCHPPHFSQQSSPQTTSLQPKGSALRNVSVCCLRNATRQRFSKLKLKLKFQGCDCDVVHCQNVQPWVQMGCHLSFCLAIAARKMR